MFVGRMASRITDIAITLCPAPTRGGGEAKASKTGSFDNTVIGNDRVSREAGRMFIFDMFRVALGQVKGSALIFDFSLAFYERAIRWACEKGQLESLELTPHTARHGGPSDDAATGRRTLKEIGERGRWESLRSVRRYKRPGTLRRQEAKLSEQHYSIAARDTSKLATLLCAQLRKQHPPGP